MLLSFLAKKKIVAFFFIGYFATVYAKLDTMAITIFAACVGAVSYTHLDVYKRQLLGFKPVQHSSVSQKRNGTVLNE